MFKKIARIILILFICASAQIDAHGGGGHGGGHGGGGRGGYGRGGYGRGGWGRGGYGGYGGWGGYGGYGWGGYGGWGWGLGLGWGYPYGYGYGYPYGYYGYAAPVTREVVVKVEPQEKPARKERTHTRWKINNQTEQKIVASNELETIILQPGENRILNHDENDFDLSIKAKGVKKRVRRFGRQLNVFFDDKGKLQIISVEK